MHRLILLRHGKAESVSATGGDFDRGLTERGRRDSALIGRVLAEAGLKPDLALVSAASRTQETWDELAHAFPNAHVEVSRQLAASLPAGLGELTSFPVEPGAVEAIASRLNRWLALPAEEREAARSDLVETASRLWSWDAVARGVLAAAAGELGELPLPE